MNWMKYFLGVGACLWASDVAAMTCQFEGFELELRTEGADLLVENAGDVMIFQPVQGDRRFWFATGSSDHGTRAEYLAFKGNRAVLTVHSVGQLVVAETFRGTCDAEIAD